MAGRRSAASSVGSRGAVVDATTTGPRSRPMISFMISLDPAQIRVTLASIQARATRYSRM
jgi:hypothetical protein